MDEAVIDAGPVIHLNQIKRLELLEFIDSLYTTEEVVDEIGRAIVESTDISEEELEAETKDNAKYLSNRYNIELGEATAISLCQQEDIETLFTDDLGARDVAKRVGLEPHGTLAIITRAYSEQILGKDEAKKAVEDLRKESSLFLTSDLVNWAKERVQEH